MTDKQDHFWIFGYGSLMWNPGFDFLRSHRARVNGLHRSPCIYSWEHRGTRSKPGIVLGLDRGGACVGSAFKISRSIEADVMAYLRARELITNVYLESNRKVILDTGDTIRAVTYIVDRNHEQYAGRLGHDDLFAHIKSASGKSGPNDRYFLDTAAQLKKMGIRDSLMENLAQSLIAN